MKVETYYEWDVETWDENDDVHDHHHGDTLDDLKSLFPLGPREHLVLVHNTYNEYEGVLDRAWAYASKFPEGVISIDPISEKDVDLRLPIEFKGGDANPKVPARYHRELARFHKAGAGT